MFGDAGQHRAQIEVRVKPIEFGRINEHLAAAFSRWSRLPHYLSERETLDAHGHVRAWKPMQRLSLANKFGRTVLYVPAFAL